MLIELIRLVVTLGFTGVGFLVGRDVPGWSSGTVDPDVAIVVGTVIGAGVGYVLGGLLGRGVRRGLDRAPQLVARASGPQLFAGDFRAGSRAAGGRGGAACRWSCSPPRWWAGRRPLSWW